MVDRCTLVSIVIASISIWFVEISLSVLDKMTSPSSFNLYFPGEQGYSPFPAVLSFSQSFGFLLLRNLCLVLPWVKVRLGTLPAGCVQDTWSSSTGSQNLRFSKSRKKPIHVKITWLVKKRKQDLLQLYEENWEKKGRKIVSSSV